jgi:peptide/nickel transport system ATP-binding protein
VSEPAILIADEPTTALDVTIQAQILNLMKELKRKFNSAMILITHNLGVVAEVCENVAVVYAGEVIEQGAVDEVFERSHNHPYTRGLFNSIPDLTTETERLLPIPGYMADPTNLPHGCKFADRCEFAFDRCRAENPPMYQLGGTHQVKCFLYSENGGV